MIIFRKKKKKKQVNKWANKWVLLNNEYQKLLVIKEQAIQQNNELENYLNENKNKRDKERDNIANV